MASSFQHFMDWLSSTLMMQNVLVHITETDLDAFLHFQHALSSFQRKITGFHVTWLLGDKPRLLEDYSNLPTFQMIPVGDRWNSNWLSLGKIALAIAMVFILGFIQMKKDLKLW